MVAESGAVLLDDAARAALVEQLLPLATVITPNLPEARVLAQSDRRRATREALARALHRLGPDAVVVTGGHRDEVVDVFFDGDTLEEISGPRHPDGAAHGSGCTHSSALAAHLALGRTPLEAARAARAIASEAVRDGLRELGGGPGPVDVFGSDSAPELARPGRGGLRRLWHNRAYEVPPHAPGPWRAADRRGRRRGRREDEERLVEMFRRQLDEGMWAAVPTITETGRRQAEMVRAFEDIPRDTDRVIFFPRAAGGARSAGRRGRVTVALCASAIVVLALLWEITTPWMDRRLDGAPRPQGGARASAQPGAYDPGRERRAEQRARELLRSCVNEEEWAMYRDLGFLRVWGGQASGPPRRTRAATSAACPTPT